MHRGEKGLSVSEVIPMSLRQIYQVYDALAQAAATLQQANFRLKCEGFVACLLVCFCVCALICLFHRTACSEAVSRQGGGRRASLCRYLQMPLEYVGDVH